MSDLGSNDLVLIVNKRLIRNLAISVGHRFQATVEQGVVLLDLAAALDPTVGTWVNRGLEHPMELIANVAMPVPRTLYATTNTNFSPAPGATPRDTLINRLQEYDLVAPGPVVGTIPVDAEIGGIPLGNPCPIQFKEDPDRRFTFLRDGFFFNNATQFLQVTAGGLEMTVRGSAYRGDLFSRRRAMNNPTHDFEMKLLYTVDFINNSDINFGPVPFKMVAAPPAPGSNLPSLPTNGSFVFARRFGDGRFVLPTLNADGSQPAGLVGQLFRGQLDDLIYESTEPVPFEPVPRYRVEPKSDDEPQRFVIREIGNPTILAEAQAGRMVLAFDSMVSLDLDPNDVSATEKNAIGNSLSKIQPTLSQVFTCAAGLTSAPVNLNLLDLLGPEGLDIPIMPRSVVIPVEAQIVTPQNNLPGPVDSVWSSISTCDLTEDKYFPDSNPHKQTFAVSGKIGGSGDESFNDFSAGADLSVGLSQVFMQPMLGEMAEGVKQSIKDNPPEGLDDSTLQVNGFINTDALQVHVEGEGEIEMPFFLPNIDYDFTADVTLHFRAQKAVVVDGNGHPRDRFDCPIPQEALDKLGLDVAYNQLELPASQAGHNPLSFLAYFDPQDGIACFDCTEIEDFRVPPPVVDANLNGPIILDPDHPPNICEDPNTDEREQWPDDPQRFGQASFTGAAVNAGLKHQWVLIPIPPTDDDVDVNVDVNLLALFFIGLLGSLLLPGLLAFLGPLGVALTPIVAVVGITALIMLPFTNLIVSAIATAQVQDRLAEQNLPSFNPDLNLTTFLGIHLDEPWRPPFALQGGPSPLPGAFITRFHVVVQSAGPNLGT